MDLNKLHHILRETTVQLRKGDEVEERRVGGVQVTEVYAMPHESQAPNGIVKVDCHFIVVGVDKAKAEAHKAELVALLKDWPSEAWGSPIPKLEEGPGYIHVGGAIGDQGAAFQLFALGQVLGLWQVITPEKLGITDPAEARQMAGSGFVMIDGFRA